MCRSASISPANTRRARTSSTPSRRTTATWSRIPLVAMHRAGGRRHHRAARPGARRENLENYIKRLQTLGGNCELLRRRREILRHSGRTRNPHHGQARAGRRRRYAFASRRRLRKRSSPSWNTPARSKSTSSARPAPTNTRNNPAPHGRLSAAKPCVGRPFEANRKAPYAGRLRKDPPAAAAPRPAASRALRAFGAQAGTPHHRPTDLLPIFRFGKPSAAKRRAAPVQSPRRRSALCFQSVRPSPAAALPPEIFPSLTY